MIQYVSSYVFFIICLKDPNLKKKKENFNLDLSCSASFFDECATF